MVENIFELSINFIETLIVMDFITRYLGFKTDKQSNIILFLGGWMLAFVELCATNYITHFEGIGGIFHALIYFIYALVVLKGSISLKIFVSLLTQIMIAIVSIGTVLCVCSILGYDPLNMLTVFNAIRVSTAIIAEVFLFYTSRLILRYRYRNPLDKSTWFMLIIMPIISFFSVICLMMAAISNEGLKGYIIGGMLGILVANVITYYFFATINKDYEIKLKVNLLEQSNENAKKNIENAKAYVQEIRAAKHDMQNMLTVIQRYIATEKYSEAGDYIRGIMQYRLPNFESYVNTENEAFNAIINSKIAICNQKNIFIDVKTMDGCIREINALDAGILFGNLLDNAIEAAENTEERRITVDVGYKGKYLSILVTNSIDRSVIANNKDLISTKKDKNTHGIGIKSIKSIVKKYDGMIQFYEEYGEFCCHILLDCDQIK